MILDGQKLCSTTITFNGSKLRPTPIVLDCQIGCWSKFKDICSTFGQYTSIILDQSKWTAPHCRNDLCQNVHMWAVQLDTDSELRSTTVILDCPNGRSSKFTLVQCNFGCPNYVIWTKEPLWCRVLYRMPASLFGLNPVVFLKKITIFCCRIHK